MNLKIGIPGWSIERKYFGVTNPYAEFINHFGTMHILSPDMEVRNDLDLLIIPGGADINPTRLSRKPSYYTGSSNPHLEYFDEHKLSTYMVNETPIIAICRGAQSIWSMFGGDIIQHNYWHTQSEHQKDECHEISWAKPEFETKYGKLIQKVNSRHHQTINGLNNVPADLEVLAYAKEGKSIMKSIVEIYRHKTLPIYGYQAHPEDMPSDRLTPLIIKELTKK